MKKYVFQQGGKVLLTIVALVIVGITIYLKISGKPLDGQITGWLKGHGIPAVVYYLGLGGIIILTGVLKYIDLKR